MTWLQRLNFYAKDEVCECSISDNTWEHLIKEFPFFEYYKSYWNGTKSWGMVFSALFDASIRFHYVDEEKTSKIMNKVIDIMRHEHYDDNCRPDV